MSTVDNRIVKMSMENGQFTSAANSTMSTLKKLGDSLKLTDGSKGLEEIAKKAKGVDMSSMAASVEEVKNRFSALDIVGVTALVNITNSAINAGKNMLKSLTIDPVMQGFSEYETKMGSITTIMTNTAHAGTTMSQVTDVLDELNLYADKTIYNFSEMTRNIGTFTAAGVDLETSATAIKGIANLAAGSGSSAQQASTAMYQLSQALAAGKVGLQDWNSVVNAGMGGKLFQNALEKTAESLGQGRNMAVSFRDSLQDGWITTEVLTKTLADFAADESLLKAATQVKTYTQLIDTMKESVQSGWAQSWEYIIGDKEEAATFFTAISDGFNNIMGPMAEYRNAALKLWSEQGGREALINGLANAAKALGSVLGPIYNSFKKIIDPWNGQRLIDLSKGFEKMTSSIKITDKTSQLLSRTADGVFSVFSIIGKVIGAAAIGIGNFISLLSPLIDGVLSITAAIGDYVVGLNDALSSTNFIGSAIDALKNGISGVATFIGNALTKLGEGISSIKNVDVSGIKLLGDIIVQSFTPSIKLSGLVSGAIDGIRWAIEKIIPALTDFAKKVWDVMQNVSQSLIDSLGGKGNAVNNIVAGGLLGAIALGVKKIFDFFKNFESDFGGVTGIVDSVKELFGGVQDTLQSFQDGIKAGTLKKIATSIAILAGSLLVISLIDSKKLVSSLSAMAVMMGELVASMVILDKLGGGAKVGLSMVIFASAILILTKALKATEDITWENLGKGLIAIAGMMAIMIASSKLIEKESKGMVQSAIAVTIFSAAINVMGSALEKIGKMDDGVIIKGLLGIGGAMLELIAFTKLIGSPKSLISTSTSMVILSGALIIMASAIEKMGTIDGNVLGKGLLGIGGALLVVGTAIRMVPKDMLVKASGIAVLSGALLILYVALDKMGNMKWDVIGRGLVAIGGALIILAAAANAMKGAIAGAAAVTIMAVALGLLTPTLMILGNMSLESIGKSILALAGVFTVLGVAGFVLAPITPVLFALAGAIALLGAACIAIGVGVAAFGTGLSLLAVSGMAGAFALVETVKIIIGVIPAIAVAIANGILAIIKTFLDNTTTIASALTTLLITVVQALNAAIPEILLLIQNIFVGILDLLIVSTPKLVEAVTVVIMSVLEALTQNIPIIAGYLTESLLMLITTVLTKIAEGIPQIASAIVDVIVAIITSIGDGVPRVVNAMFDMVIKMINGLTNAVQTRMPEVRSAIKGLVTAIINEFKAAISDAVNVGGNIVDGLTRGIKNGIGAVTQAAKNVASSALNAAKSFLGIHSPSREFAKLGMYSDQGLANGLDKHSGLVEDSAMTVADSALSSMKTALSTVNELFNDDIDSTPVIRPVLDLTEIQNGKSEIGDLVGGDNAIKVAAISARRTAAGFTGTQVSTNDQAVPITTNNNKTEIVNHFNITGDNPQDIAEEVSRIIQNQVERRDIVWE